MELKSCPFCGGKASICEAESEDKTLFMVACESCGITTAASENGALVVADWNRRVA